MWNTGVFEVMKCQISLLDETAATAGPGTLVWFDSIVSALVFLHITPPYESFATIGVRTHELLLSCVWLSVIIQRMLIWINNTLGRGDKQTKHYLYSDGHIRANRSGRSSVVHESLFYVCRNWFVVCHSTHNRRLCIWKAFLPYVSSEQQMYGLITESIWKRRSDLMCAQTEYISAGELTALERTLEGLLSGVDSFVLS